MGLSSVRNFKFSPQFDNLVNLTLEITIRTVFKSELNGLHLTPHHIVHCDHVNGLFFALFIFITRVLSKYLMKKNHISKALCEPARKHS